LAFLFVTRETGARAALSREAYSDPRTHRSREVSTMAPLEHFFDLPFVCDASALLGTQDSPASGAELVGVLVAETIHPACMCEGGGRAGERGGRAFWSAFY